RRPELPYGLFIHDESLQWGRRVFATETCSRSRQTSGPRCFNGAVACSRRRPPPEDEVPPELGGLQWGRRVFATETGFHGWGGGGGATASRGPSRVGAGDMYTQGATA